MDQFLTVNRMPRAVKYFSLLLSLGFAYLFLIDHSPLEERFELNYVEFQSVFTSQLEVASNELVALQKNFDETNKDASFYEKKRETIYEKDHISLFIYKEDEALYWSEDQSPTDLELLDEKIGLYHSGSGLFYKIIEKEGPLSFIALIQFTYDYDYENKYLNNRFTKAFNFPSVANIGSLKTDYPIYDLEQKVAFYLSEKKTQPPASKYPILEFLGFMLFILNTVWLLPSLFFSRFPLAKKVIISSLLLFLRIFLFLQLPPAFANADLFQSEFFALSAYIPSLGDLFLHVLVIFFLVLIWRKNIEKSGKLGCYSLLALTLFFGHLILKMIHMSVEQSQISFQLSDLFGIDFLSFIFFISLSILLLSFFNLLDLSSQIIQKHFSVKRVYLITFLVFVAIALLHIASYASWVYYWLPLSMLLSQIIRLKKNKNYLLLGVILLLTTAYTVTHQIQNTIATNELTAQKIYLTKLSEENDPILEYLFDGVSQEISQDVELKRQINSYWSSKEAIDNYIVDRYFQAYWNQYQIQLSLCDANDSIYISNWESSTSCQRYFLERIDKEKKNEAVENLYQLKNLVGRIDYIGKINISADSIDYTLFVELGRNLINTNEGYPELLLEENTNLSDVLSSDYSYAVYLKNKLIYKVGEFNYATEKKTVAAEVNSFQQSAEDNFQHTTFQKDEQTTLVLSHQLTDVVSKITGVAYLFILIGLLYLFFSLSSSSFMLPLPLRIDHFTTKVQLFLVGSLLTALLGLSVGTSYFIMNQYQDKNLNQLAEKLRSLRIEIESKIGGEDFLSPQLEEYVASKLIQFSNVFYTDINIYNTSGTLYSTSRPEIFDKGLKGKRIHPAAYTALQLDKRSEWNQLEQIGNLKYMSAYVPIVNYENKVLGYLNLPYFAKQGQLQKEISAFLASTLNIYVGIFLIALLISVFLIEQIAKPLRLLKNQIGKLKIGSSIHLIDWKSNDEIGALVSEYNRIAVELNESADQLAKSERESAWREMAKQVAHEIKNPLTPIKLSVQHLQRAEHDDPAALKAQLNKTAAVIIEQIDSLSNIASAFSSFAKLPEGKLEELELLPVLQNTISLHESEANIQLKVENNDSIRLMGNKDYLIRLFNNLLKNAIQASKHLSPINIEVSLFKKDFNCRVEVKDYGSGVNNELRHRIFEPNFTTKSRGTGLGLAMSKSIVEHLGGQIGFNSVVEKETTFWVELPLIKEEHPFQ